MLDSGVRLSGSQPLGNEDILLPFAVTSVDLKGIREKYQIPQEIKILHPLLFDFVQALGLTLP